MSSATKPVEQKARELLIERLRARRRVPAIHSSYTGKLLSVSGVEYLINPDGPEAADEIARLETEIERLIECGKDLICKNQLARRRCGI